MGVLMIRALRFGVYTRALILGSCRVGEWRRVEILQKKIKKVPKKGRHHEMSLLAGKRAAIPVTHHAGAQHQASALKLMPQAAVSVTLRCRRSTIC